MGKNFIPSDLDNRDELLRRIVNQVTGGITCYQYGICVALAYELTKAFLEHDIYDFVVKEGWVDDGGPEPSAHTWIEMLDGTPIDPSFPRVFGSAAAKTAEIQAVFKPREFIEYAEEDMGLG